MTEEAAARLATDSVNAAPTHAERPWLYAGFWKRVVASLVDSLIIFVVNIGLKWAFVALVPIESSSNAQLWMVLPEIVFAWLFEALLVSSVWQATPGKMLLRIKVVDYHNQRVSFGRATARHFAKTLSMLLLFIGFIMVAYTQRKQGLHDMIAGTLVVNRPRA